MTTSNELNRDTHTPHRVSLGDILASIQVTPGEANALLSRWADHFLGGAHHNLGRMLRDHATMVADPQTYGYKAPEPAVVTNQPEYQPPVAPVYAQQFAGARDDAATATGSFEVQRTAPPSDTKPPTTVPPDIHGVPLTPDETRQYQHPQGGALDRLAMQQRDERIAQLERELAESRGQKQAATFSAPSEATRPDEIA